MSWQEEFNRKLVSAEEAVKTVKSGDRVVIPALADPLALEMALIARKEELKDVEVHVLIATRDLPWYEPGWEDSFNPRVWFIHHPAVREAVNRTKGDIDIGMPSLFFKAEERPEGRKTDVVLVEVSPPDEHGFCSFGATLWDKKARVKNARTSIAEVKKDLVRTYGDNFIHVSEIDYFVPVDYPPVELWPPLKPGPQVRPIAENISTLVRDGDIIEIGAGTTSETLPLAGVFEGKHDLGWHTERIPRGCLRLMRDQPDLFTGRHNRLNPGKAVATALALSPGDAEFVHQNPMFELYGVDYIHDIRVIARHDNMVAINNALAIDLTGQVCSEALGSQVWSGIGGQLEFAAGSILSSGGRSIFVLPSTAMEGAVSRIVPFFQAGTPVSVPRTLVDYVVTEYGVAALMGKSLKERAGELIAIAHPDFRGELRREGQKVYGL